MFQKPLAHKLFRKLVVSMHEVKQTLPAQEVLTPTCLDKKSPGHRDPMPPEEEEEGGKMGTCVFLASPNFGGLEVLSAPGSHPSPKAWPGLVGERWGGGSLLVSHASFLQACEGACWGYGLQDAPSFSRWVLELDPQDPSLRAAGGCPLAGFLMPRWPLALGVWDVE